ncbi:MAG: hypothetical protein U5J97_11615 [Trueperaceae bacterium]|nr:hypothetical protein [Trueperaceae bacterium]
MNVTAVNDPPTVTIAEAGYAATEQIATDLHGTGITVGDPDSESADVRLTVTIPAGDHSGTLAADAGTTGATDHGATAARERPGRRHDRRDLRPPRRQRAVRR